MPEASNSKELRATLTIATLALIHLLVFVPNTITWTLYDVSAIYNLGFGERNPVN